MTLRIALLFTGLQLGMDTVLKIGDQIYRFVFARSRWPSEIIAIVIVAILIHASINFFAGRAANESSIATPTNVNKTSGDQSPVISDPQAPVTINQESRK